jgi:predicted molibdopterin-dependent oxidoreductase YjgC
MALFVSNPGFPGRRRLFMRILNHPILGFLESRKKVEINVDGKKIEAFEGEPIAAAMMACGVRALRKTRKRQQWRGVFCGIGRCTDCMMIVDGIPNVRTCITPVKSDMVVKTQVGFGEEEDDVSL